MDKTKITELMPDKVPPEISKAIVEGRLCYFAVQTLLKTEEQEREIVRQNAEIEEWEKTAAGLTLHLGLEREKTEKLEAKLDRVDKMLANSRNWDA